MVLVMPVAVFVLEQLVHVHVFVLVTLADVEPDANHHQPRRHAETPSHRLAEQEDANERTDERRGREVRAGPSCAQASEGHHEQDKTHAIAQQSDQGGEPQYGRARSRRAERQRDGDVNASGDETLHRCNL